MSKYTQIKCPVCGHRGNRVSRRFFERLMGVFIPIRRYRCQDTKCGWEGGLIEIATPLKRESIIAQNRAKFFQNLFIFFILTLVGIFLAFSLMAIIK